MKSNFLFDRLQVGNLALLIARMQKNADTVEKDVLRAEELLLIVRNTSFFISMI